MMKNLIERDITIEDIKIYLTLFKLHKSYLLLISDQKDIIIILRTVKNNNYAIC